MVSFYKFTVWSNLPQHTGRHLLPAWQSAGDLAFFMIIESSQSVLSIVICFGQPERIMKYGIYKPVTSKGTRREKNSSFFV